MNKIFSLTVLCFISNISFIVEACERSLEIRGVEDYCWTKNVEIGDRLQHTGKNLLNFAKKKLGMDVETDNEPQKCDYYRCLFQELKMMNAEGFPCRERTTKWIKNNVIYKQAMILLSQVDKCSDRLSNSTVSGTYFYGEDKIDENIDKGDIKPLEPQSKCDIAAEYMNCMSLVEKDENCPVFVYP